MTTRRARERDAILSRSIYLYLVLILNRYEQRTKLNTIMLTFHEGETGMRASALTKIKKTSRPAFTAHADIYKDISAFSMMDCSIRRKPIAG